MKTKIIDNFNNQVLTPMSIYYKDGEVVQVKACKPNDDPLRDGWYDLKGDDLKHIEVIIEDGGDKNSLLSGIKDSHQEFSHLSTILRMKPEDTCDPEELKAAKEAIIECLDKVRRFEPCGNDVMECDENVGGDDSP